MLPLFRLACLFEPDGLGCNPPVKILLDALQSTNLSGTGSYASALVRHLPGVLPGGALHVACPEAQSALLANSGLAAIIPCSSGRFPVGTLRRTAQMRTALQEIQPDIVHYPANFARWAGRGGVASAKVVLTVHDLSFLRLSEWFRWERAAYYRAAIRPSVRLADMVIADSQATADDLRKFLAVPEDRLAVVYLGVSDLQPADEAVIRRTRLKYGLPERFFLYLGTIEPRKNLPRLIAAFDAVAAKTDVSLVIAGREGWKAQATKQAYADAAYRDRIKFPGFVAGEDMAALMSAATAFVWPSLWEGFGLPPLEAMACGTPVITSNTSSLPEVTGGAALLVNPESVDEIAEAMLRVINDDALRAKLREAGLARARTLTWRRTAEETAAVYRRVTGG